MKFQNLIKNCLSFTNSIIIRSACMCGILGQINFKNLKIDQTNFKQSLDLQKHRGPDDFDDNISFGHRRLRFSCKTTYDIRLWKLCFSVQW